MALSAYFVEDPFVKIVSITIGLAGASFVVKTYDSEIFYGIAQGSAEQSDEWHQWSEPFDVFGFAANNSGSSSALIKEHDADPGKPVWVVSARKENDATGSNGCIFLYSEDGGATWDLVFERYEVDEGNDRVPFVIEPTGIVWDADERAFFASFHVFDWHRSGPSGEFIDEPEGEEIYRSADGRAWDLVSRNLHLTDVDDVNVLSDLNGHCNKPENQNRRGGSQKIADGLQGYNPNTGIFIAPAALAGFDPFNGARYDGGTGTATATPFVTVFDEAGNPTTKSVSGRCYAVACHSNVWLAVGGDRAGIPPNRGGTFIDVSFDDGQTWTNVFQSPATATYHAATVSGQRSA